MSNPRRVRLDLVAKGACMGVADVIPGVSGGTIALMLGIYRPFIQALGSLSARPVMPGLRWMASGFSTDRRAPFLEALATIRFGFLIPLGIGIVTAIAVGSAVIPGLIERYPEIMRGLFFGLIVASIPIPIRLIPRDRLPSLLAAIALALLTTVGSYWLTDPNRVADLAGEQTTVIADGETDLEHLLREGPSAHVSEAVFWAPANAELRDAIEAAEPETFAALTAARDAASGDAATDKSAIKARSLHYNELIPPAGTPLQVPRPAYWFTFIAGCIAICAMVLPGISGSFLLLIMGMYFFVLNALKGAVGSLLRLEPQLDAFAYVATFVAGLAVGIITFSRVLSWLLKRFPGPTMGALTGLMIGSLRALWPFQSVRDGILTNTLPAALDGTVVASLVALALGMVIVAVLTIIGARLGGAEPTH